MGVEWEDGGGGVSIASVHSAVNMKALSLSLLFVFL